MSITMRCGEDDYSLSWMIEVMTWAVVIKKGLTFGGRSQKRGANEPGQITFYFCIGTSIS